MLARVSDGPEAASLSKSRAAQQLSVGYKSEGRAWACRSNATRSLLPGDTESLTGSAGGLGSLTLDLEVPEVTETSVIADLLHTLQILSESRIDNVGVNLGPGAIFDAPLSVQEPLWNSVIYNAEIDYEHSQFYKALY